MRNIVLLLCIAFWSTLSAYDMPSGGNLSTSIYNSVNIITGEYCNNDAAKQYPQIEYYELGDNDVGDITISIDNPEDLRIGKVKLLLAPIGENSSPMIMNRFFYFDEHTDVYNALDHRTTFFHSNQQQISAIEYYNEAKQLHHVERFFWNHSFESPKLTSHAYEDGEGTVVLCQTIKYNSNGQIIQESLYGNLTGKNNAPILLEDTGFPFENGIEVYQTHYTYSEEAPYPLIMIHEDNGNTTQYVFDSDNHKLLTKLVSDISKVRIRHLFSYDENGRIVKTTIDDGSSKDPNNLSDVTEQYITINFYQNDPECILPKMTEEWHRDLAKDTEILTKQTQFQYSGNNIIQQIVNDYRNDSVEEFHYTYDEENRQIASEDSSGNVSEYAYDMHGNKISVRQTSAEGNINAFNYTYDCANRLVRSEEFDNEGKTIATSYQYDVLGNQIAVEDTFGNVTSCSYDAFSLVSITYPTMTNDQNQSINLSETRRYDIFNRVTSVTDAQKNTTQTTYNVRGKPTHIHYSNGTDEKFEYNLDGSLAVAKAKDGSTSKFKYDYLARITDMESCNASGTITNHTQNCYKGFHFLPKDKEASDKPLENGSSTTVLDALYGVYKQFAYITSKLTTFLKNYSYEKAIQPEVDQVALDVFGKTYLAMSGYYADAPDAGIYGNREFGNHVRVTAINGILNLRNNCINTVKALSDTHGGINIHYVFNPTEGWASDMFKATLAKFGYVSPQVKLLAETWRKLIEEMGGVNGGGIIVHYAHSIGGTNTVLAKAFLSPEEQKMIHVVSVGSASMIPNEGFASAINYISRRDFVACVSLLLSVFHPSPEGDTHVSIVGSHLDGWPVIDHLLTGETYLRAIEVLGKKFIDQHGP